MSTKEILETLALHGVSVSPKLRFEAAKDMTPEVYDLLKTHRDDILRYLILEQTPSIYLYSFLERVLYTHHLDWLKADFDADILPRDIDQELTNIWRSNLSDDQKKQVYWQLAKRAYLFPERELN